VEGCNFAGKGELRLAISFRVLFPVSLSGTGQAGIDLEGTRSDGDCCFDETTIASLALDSFVRLEGT
jgi:hypothetical protein